MYLITTESDDDGIWSHDPIGFNSETEARDYIPKLPPPGAGHSHVLYRCDQIAVLAGKAAA